MRCYLSRPPSADRYGRPTTLQRRPVTDPPSTIRRSQYPLARANHKRMVCHRKTRPPYRFGHGRVVSLRVATSSSAGRSKPPLNKRAPIWVWKRNDSGMTKPLRGARPWCWPYLLWWCCWLIPSLKKQPVASDKGLGIAKQNPLSPMHSLGCENTSGNIFQGQFHTQTGKNQQRESSNALSISFAMLHEWIKSSLVPRNCVPSVIVG